MNAIFWNFVNEGSPNKRTGAGNDFKKYVNMSSFLPGTAENSISPVPATISLSYGDTKLPGTNYIIWFHFNSFQLQSSVTEGMVFLSIFIYKRQYLSAPHSVYTLHITLFPFNISANHRVKASQSSEYNVGMWRMRYTRVT